MINRKALKQAYKETAPQAGIFQLKNKINGKICLGSSTNLHGPLNREKMMLNLGNHRNPALQADWKQYGEANFEFGILEEFDTANKSRFEVDEELSLLEEIWLEKLQPFGEKGYNFNRKIRI